MNARLPLFIGLLAFAGVAVASARPTAPDPSGQEGVDLPDPPADPIAALDIVMGDWGPTAIYDQVGQQLGGIVNTQQLSAAGLDQLKVEEDFSATPYPDHKGDSIGYGHLIKPGEDLTYVTEAQATDLLLQDVATAEATVSGAVKVGLTPNQFDALVLFTYNVGSGAFRSSTLLRLLNAGDYSGAAAQFGRWVNASGVPQPTLVARRDREQTLFES